MDDNNDVFSLLIIYFIRIYGNYVMLQGVVIAVITSYELQIAIRPHIHAQVSIYPFGIHNSDHGQT